MSVSQSEAKLNKSYKIESYTRISNFVSFKDNKIIEYSLHVVSYKLSHIWFLDFANAKSDRPTGKNDTSVKFLSNTMGVYLIASTKGV